MIQITPHIFIDESDLDISAIRAQGAGGQNVNKVSSAIHLRFNINSSALSDYYKQRLLASADQRINKDGILIIKAQKFRSQEKNRIDAIERLQGIIRSALVTKKVRRPTKPSKSSQKKRLDKKTKHSRTKSLRRQVTD